MAGERAAIRYAKAVLSLATDNNTTDVVNNDMELINNTVAQSKDLKDINGRTPYVTEQIGNLITDVNLIGKIQLNVYFE